MLGVLPKRYRRSIAALVLGACVVLGLWLGANPDVPILAQAGLTLGLAAGVPLAWLLTHAPRHDTPSVSGEHPPHSPQH
ncbi:hypothetical protein [Nocardioides malaquae]|nr:hypothetical protein [Nocardioides malaquae]